MTIFYVEEDDLEAANNLGLHTKNPVLKLGSDAQIGEATELTLVAKMDHEMPSIAGRTPVEIADTLAKLYQTSERSMLKTLYLVDSRAEEKPNENGPLLQQLAVEMNKLGFANLLVSAIALPIGNPGDGIEMSLIKEGADKLDGLSNWSDESCYSIQEIHEYSSLTPESEEALESGITDIAIQFLKDQKQHIIEAYKNEPTKKERLLAYIATDINKLKKNPSLTVDEVNRLLHSNRSEQEFKLSDYCNEVLIPLGKVIEQAAQKRVFIDSNFNLSKIPLTSSKTPSPTLTLSSFSFHVRPTQMDATTMTDIDFTPIDILWDKLDTYIEARKNEWGFHYNFIGIISTLYLIQYALTSTDSFNIKSRDVKISAATKLQNMIDGDQTIEFTQHEEQALMDGRLGVLVEAHGGLDKILELIDKYNNYEAAGLTLNSYR